MEPSVYGCGCKAFISHIEHCPMHAAAPALLEAAEKALNYITNTENEWGIVLDSGDMLRAAIAQARGGK